MTAPADITRRAVFLDRDGVLNRTLLRDGRRYAPARLDEFELLPGVVEAAQRLKQAGFALVVVTNQPDVAAGRVSRETVEQMHRALRTQIPLDAVQVCYHVDADACACRKPKPGMILDASDALHLDRTTSYMVGDRWRDVEAGRAAGCRTILVDGIDEGVPLRPDATAPSLEAAAQLILAES